MAKTDNNQDNLPEIDIYGLNHLAYHLIRAGDYNKLYKLLIGGSKWLEIKFSILQTGDEPYARELELAIDSLKDPLNSEQILTLCALYSAKQVLLYRTVNRSDTDLKILTMLGDTSLALSYARLRTNYFERFHGILSVFETVNERDDKILKELEDIVVVIPVVADRVTAMRELGFYFVKLAKNEKARSFLNEADRLSLQIQNPTSKLSALAALAETLSASAYFNVAQNVLSIIDTTESDTDEAKIKLINSLVRLGKFSEAKDVLDKIQNNENRRKASIKISIALANNGNFSQAFKTAETISNDEFFQFIGELAPSFEKVQKKLSVRVFQEAARVIGWIRMDWNEIFTLLERNF